MSWACREGESRTNVLVLGPEHLGGYQACHMRRRIHACHEEEYQGTMKSANLKRLTQPQNDWAKLSL